VPRPIHAHRREMSSDPPSQPPPHRPPPARPAWRFVVLWLALIAAVALVLHSFVGWAMGFISAVNADAGSLMMVNILIVTLIVYALLIATPFMPGIEVGVGLLLMQGASIAPYVYLATVSGLMFAYLIGSTIPLKWLRKFFCDLGLKRVCAFLDQAETTPIETRLAQQRAMLPKWLGKLTVDYKYVTIAVLLNLPGTFAIGGG